MTTVSLLVGNWTRVGFCVPSLGLCCWLMLWALRWLLKCCLLRMTMRPSLIGDKRTGTTTDRKTHARNPYDDDTWHTITSLLSLLDNQHLYIVKLSALYTNPPFPHQPSFLTHNSPVKNCALPIPKLQSSFSFLATLITKSLFGT
jgi:hypothetical protein